MNVTRPSHLATIADRFDKSITSAPTECGHAETRIIVVEPDRRLVRVSDAGARMLREEAALRLAMDRVRGVAQIDDARLERAVAQAASGPFELILPLGPKRAGLSLSVVSLHGSGEDVEVMLLIRDARDERRRALARAAAFFGFTTAETRLVSALYEGCSVPDAACRLGVAPTTARSHLQNIFAKTGVRRQGDLLTLLSSGHSAIAFAA